MELAPGILGQDFACELLTRALAQGRIAPAYLFVGPEGVGKATVARHFASRLLGDTSGRVARGNHPDLLWVEPTYKKGDKLLTRTEALAEGSLPRSQPQIRLEQVRAVAAFLARGSVEAGRRVVVVEGAQALGEAAANALLKTLEEPGNGVFVLTAGELRLMLATVVSRCQKIPFFALADADLRTVLARLAVAPPPEHLVAMAAGSPGRVLQLVEWQAGVPPELFADLERWAAGPVELRFALGLARQIAEVLTVESQVLLVDTLQHLAWSRGRPEPIAPLEALRTQLLSYVNPRLAWEVALAGPLLAAHG